MALQLEEQAKIVAINPPTKKASEGIEACFRLNDESLRILHEAHVHSVNIDDIKTESALKNSVPVPPQKINEGDPEHETRVMPDQHEPRSLRGSEPNLGEFPTLKNHSRPEDAVGLDGNYEYHWTIDDDLSHHLERVHRKL